MALQIYCTKALNYQLRGICGWLLGYWLIRKYTDTHTHAHIQSGRGKGQWKHTLLTYLLFVIFSKVPGCACTGSRYSSITPFFLKNTAISPRSTGHPSFPILLRSCLLSPRTKKASSNPLSHVLMILMLIFMLILILILMHSQDESSLICLKSVLTLSRSFRHLSSPSPSPSPALTSQLI